MPVTIITGGTGALGRAVTERFLAAVGKVMATFVVDTEAEEVRTGLSSFGASLCLYKADVATKEGALKTVQAALDQFGSVDNLLNLAGGFGMSPIEESPPDLPGRMLELNYKTAYWMTAAAMPHFRKSGQGRIVNVGARAALQPAANMASYVASKAAVLALTHATATELQGTDICCNAILPSVIDTPANRKSMPKADFSRWVSPQQIANVVAWLCSPDAEVVSGAEIPVYGRAIE